MPQKRTSLTVEFHNPNGEREMLKFLLSIIAEDFLTNQNKNSDQLKEGAESESSSILPSIDR